MPLKLNAGLSRKIADQNYGSRGASVNLEIELDAGLVTEPGKLQERIRQLFAVVRTSLSEELNGNAPAPGAEASNGHAKPPENGNGSSRSGGQRQATQSQVKAIHAIARNKRIDLGKLLNDRFRIARPDDLSLREASQVIDELKDDTKGAR